MAHRQSRGRNELADFTSLNDDELVEAARLRPVAGNAKGRKADESLFRTLLARRPDRGLRQREGFDRRLQDAFNADPNANPNAPRTGTLGPLIPATSGRTPAVGNAPLIRGAGSLAAATDLSSDAAFNAAERRANVKPPRRPIARRGRPTFE